MAAKPFYSLDEVCARLGKSPDDIKGMVREGMLREFRDAGKVFFKAEEYNGARSKQETIPRTGDSTGGGCGHRCTESGAGMPGTGSST